MLSIRNILAAAVVLVSSARADYVIDPNSVSLTNRNNWCQSEKSTCPLICQQTTPGTTLVNDCDPKTLTYGCICGDQLQPNVSEYSLTLPYFVCQEWGNQCVKNCGQDNTCSSSCREDHPCGALHPTRPNTTSTASSSATATGATATDSNAVFTGLAGSSSDSNNNNAAFRVGASDGMFGFVILAASVSLGVFLL
ncbi:uncharacterized protein GGS22DRAFT_170414 [Annulohypoxylon maeteangense]|uniref:uncharacterized protein n=1 Tax=Annulohypoxylon maeteangense TaxID=1927788 RepID=UPI0020079D1E|nr:uncharacterized protein GGS22DRAFT_170414 [Annulohypoxylon maeteangense]KAI0882188.1 hypothetical protein GGS22DRAFT_170414 [Annulohypoxylon maeteangense]